VPANAAACHPAGCGRRARRLPACASWRRRAWHHRKVSDGKPAPHVAELAYRVYTGLVPDVAFVVDKRLIAFIHPPSSPPRTPAACATAYGGMCCLPHRVSRHLPSTSRRYRRGRTVPSAATDTVATHAWPSHCLLPAASRVIRLSHFFFGSPPRRRVVVTRWRCGRTTTACLGGSSPQAIFWASPYYAGLSGFPPLRVTAVYFHRRHHIYLLSSRCTHWRFVRQRLALPPPCLACSPLLRWFSDICLFMGLFHHRTGPAIRASLPAHGTRFQPVPPFRHYTDVLTGTWLVEGRIPVLHSHLEWFGLDISVICVADATYSHRRSNCMPVGRDTVLPGASCTGGGYVRMPPQATPCASTGRTRRDGCWCGISACSGAALPAIPPPRASRHGGVPSAVCYHAGCGSLASRASPARATFSCRLPPPFTVHFTIAPFHLLPPRPLPAGSALRRAAWWLTR